MSINALLSNPSMIYAPNAPGALPSTQTSVGVGNSASDFQQALSEGINKINQEQVQADTQVQEMVSSQGANLHEAMIALSRAEITLRLGIKVGQKMVNAYQELQRIQI